MTNTPTARAASRTPLINASFDRETFPAFELYHRKGDQTLTMFQDSQDSPYGLLPFSSWIYGSHSGYYDES